MTRCKKCNETNDITNDYCWNCKSLLPDPNLKNYILDNAQIFTVLSLFGALSYYLLNLLISLGTENTTWQGNISGNFFPQNSSMKSLIIDNFTITGKIIPKSSVILSSDIALEMGVLFSFFIFVIIVLTVCNDIVKEPKYHKFSFAVFVFSILMFVAMELVYMINNFLYPMIIFVSLMTMVATVYVYYWIGNKFENLKSRDDFFDIYLLIICISVLLVLIIPIFSSYSLPQIGNEVIAIGWIIEIFYIIIAIILGMITVGFRYYVAMKNKK
jgi:hypothetical protein